MKLYDVIYKNGIMRIVIQINNDDVICYDQDLKYVHMNLYEPGWETIHECNNIICSEIYMAEHL